ncbi:MAG: hypothetical protein K2Y71_06155 [Xanthobacteraceae bacterium]|nr:hypothetical protein [Xanthobacteraceae bacterium]
MADISLSEFDGDTIVVHFGGDFAAIDAYTLAESLIGLADTARAVSALVDPGQEIQIVVEATGPGSYRTVIRRVRRGMGGFFSEGAKAIFWGIIGTIIYDAILRNEPPINVSVNTNEVIIHRGHERIIVPRNVYDAAEQAKKGEDVQKGLRRIFAPLEANPSVTEFGLTKRLTDPAPVIRLPRETFPVIVRATAHIEETTTERIKTERARLLILKAWLNHANRKWSFEWNGVPIRAPITDHGFLDEIARRDHLLGAGDALDVEIMFVQKFDPGLEMYVNDPNSYVITQVVHVVHG